MTLLCLFVKITCCSFFEFKAPLIDEDWLKTTKPMGNGEFYALQFLEDNKNNEKIDLVDNFFTFKLVLLATFLISCALVWFLKFFIVFYKRIFRKRQMNFVQFVRKFASVFVSSSTKYRITALSVLVLFFSQFLWFSALVVTSSIKTDTVIVDTR